MQDGTSIQLPGNPSTPIEVPLEPDMTVFDDGTDDNPDTKGNPSDKVQVDNKFAHLPEQEAHLKSLKSQYDKLYVEHMVLNGKYEDQANVTMFFELMNEDRDLRLAYLNSKDPDLIPKGDTKSLVMAKIKENPRWKDFEPNPEDRDLVGSDTWLYYRDMSKIYDDVDVSGTNPEKIAKVDEVLNQLNAKKKKTAEDVQKQLIAIKKTHGYSDAYMNAGLKWANHLGLPQIFKMYAFALKGSKKAVGPDFLTSGTPPTANENEAKVSQLFGGQISGFGVHNTRK